MNKQEEGKGQAPGRRRVFIWVLEAVVLLACLEQFVLKPRFAKRKAHAVTAVKAVEAREPVPSLEDAWLPKGCVVSEGAHLAVLEGLAEGSASAQATQVSVSRDTRFPVEISNSIGMKFRLVPAGTYMMGSPETEKGHCKVESQHLEVVPSHFYMGMYEVTQAQWKAVMGSDKNPSGYLGDDRPVEEITWYDCQRFVLKLCEMEGLPIGAYRMPTEVEWEYACRGGTQTAYCFGDSPSRLGKYADYADNNYRSTSPVGGKLPNAWGLYDMHGNVWEWCIDDYKNYPGDDTPETEANKYPCIRGGNWYIEAENCRSATRARLPTASHGNMLGFRVLREIAR